MAQVIMMLLRFMAGGAATSFATKKAAGALSQTFLKQSGTDALTGFLAKRAGLMGLLNRIPGYGIKSGEKAVEQMARKTGGHIIEAANQVPFMVGGTAAEMILGGKPGNHSMNPTPQGNRYPMRQIQQSSTVEGIRQEAILKQLLEELNKNQHDLPF